MVFQHSIPFGAPSQFRLQMTMTADGQADLAVLDAFNQPIGNLNHMRAPADALAAVCKDGGEKVTATGQNAHISIERTDDPEWLKVFYADEESFIERDTTVMIEELCALVEDAKSYVT